MGGLSRTKGKVGERELARLLSSVTGHSVTRRVRQHDGDDDLTGVPGWSIECKRYAVATPALLQTWWEQAVVQSQRTNALPLLVYRADRADWRAVWPAELHLPLRPATLSASFDDTVSGTPSTWWQLVRGLQ